jgi:hypothetical protein
MASFTDNLVAFNPYVSEIPVDDYVRVGMIKQQQYNAGVEKVQGYIDSVAGLDVIKPEQKDYLSQRINNLKQEVGKVVQADFSQQQIVNSVGSLTNRIASDPIIQNSVASTQTYRQQLAAMRDAKDKGKSSVSNEWDFNDQFNKWYNDKDLTTRFTGSFTPYVDVTSKISKIIKDLDPNVHIEDNPFLRGGDGQILIGKDGAPMIDMAMIEKSSTTLTPERIQAAISANMTQDDINQLRIDGRYSYRGQDAMGMKQITDQSYQYKLDQINDIIEGLIVTKGTLNNDPQKAAEVDAKIEAYKQKATSYQNRYRQDVAAINSNLEGYKGSLYAQNWLSKFGDGYAYAKESLTYKENPYFQAAERRRENDIKWQEFLIDQQWKAADAAYKNESLRLGWYNAETARLKGGKGSGKTAQGALEGIGLSDAILEPIQQDEMEKIDVGSFMADTERVSEDIDQQRMSLLGNTGLVTLKRDATGQNPRYEYNVAGKDPQAVKDAANAAIAKLKDAYDKDPNSVDDGARSFFRNQANADQTIQNRKFAIGQQERYADRDVGTIAPMLNAVRPMTITTGGKPYVVDAKQMMDFNEKLKNIFKTGVDMDVPYAYYDDNEAKRVLAGPAEWEMYQAAKTPASKRNETQKIIAAKLQQTHDVVNRPNQQLVRARNNYLDNSVKSLVGTQQPVSFTLEAFEAPDRKRAQAVASRLVNTIIAEDKENPNPRYDADRIQEMLGKDAENTTYSLVSKGRGRYALGLSNTKTTGEPVEMDLTRQQAEELFGQGQFLDDFYNIRQSLQLTKGTAKWTTDVRGIGKDGAFNVNNGNLNRFSVKYHVEEPLKNGGLQVRMYIYDKMGVDPKTGQQTGAWLPERTAGFGQLLNEAQVTKFLSNVGDQYIQSILQNDK